MNGKPLKQPLTVVIPAFNEEKRIFPSVQAINGHLEKAAPEFEIIVVADGCSDRTTDVIHRASERIKNLKLLPQKKQGQGVLCQERGPECTRRPDPHITA